MGGDEYYIDLNRTKPQVVGIATDQNNGELSFHAQETLPAPFTIENPTIRLFLLHACGQKINAPPLILRSMIT